jgi:hypothetical protein
MEIKLLERGGCAPAVVRAPDGRFVSEHYDVRLVFSTRDFVRAPPAPASSKTAVLVGNPAFNLQGTSDRKSLCTCRTRRRGKVSPAISGPPNSADSNNSTK